MSGPTWEIREGDALERLREMDDESVNCCVTSPPYFGLRDYGTGAWVDGDPECSHQMGRQTNRTNGGTLEGTQPTAGNIATWKTCRHCGAVRVDQQIGLEDTLEEFVANLVGVFDEVRRVLRKDGTLWLNLGDSYAGSWGAQGHTGQMVDRGITAARSPNTFPQGTRTGSIPEGADYKPKDLLGVPWTVAFALRSAGWWLRSDIIWAKRSPMPESVTDRPTRAHEYLFLLSRSSRYFYDADAIREPHSATSIARVGPEGVRADAERKVGSTPDGKQRWNSKEIRLDERGANKRSVWSIASQPFSGAHFATFPPKLVEPCVLAGCPEDGTVLDPFAGAATTGLVALRRNRSFIGIELNPVYADMGRQRLRDDAPLLNTVAEVAA